VKNDTQLKVENCKNHNHVCKLKSI